MITVCRDTSENMYALVIMAGFRQPAHLTASLVLSQISLSLPHWPPRSSDINLRAASNGDFIVNQRTVFGVIDQ